MSTKKLCEVCLLHRDEELLTVLHRLEVREDERRHLARAEVTVRRLEPEARK